MRREMKAELKARRRVKDGDEDEGGGAPVAMLGRGSDDDNGGDSGSEGGSDGGGSSGGEDVENAGQGGGRGGGTGLSSGSDSGSEMEEEEEEDVGGRVDLGGGGRGAGGKRQLQQQGEDDETGTEDKEPSCKRQAKGGPEVAHLGMARKSGTTSAPATAVKPLAATAKPAPATARKAAPLSLAEQEALALHMLAQRR